MFHNIFKKNGKMTAQENKPKPKIIADIHEKNSLVISSLYEIGCEVELSPLKVGDYIVGQTIIERKTFGDFLNSMINKRMIQQINQFLQYKRALLIIEGFNMERIEKCPDTLKINPNAIRGFLLSIMLNHKIPIVFTENSEETAIYLKVLAKQEQNPRQEYSLHSRIPKTANERKKYILESFPNIGPKTAEKLLKKFKTIKNIINAPQEELLAEIGKKAEAIINLRD